MCPLFPQVDSEDSLTFIIAFAKLHQDVHAKEALFHMTTAELVDKVKSLGRRERKKFFTELLAQKEFEEIAEDIEDIVVSVSRSGEPTIPARKFFANLRRRRKRR